MMNNSFSDLFVRNRSFYQTFVRLAGALMLEQAVVLSVNLADNLMLGTYSEAALSGVAAVNQIQFVYQQVVYAVGNAVIILGSQYWGKRRMREIRNIAAVGIWTELAVALLLFGAAAVIPQHMVRMFTGQPLFISEGMAYLRILKYTFPFFAVTTLLLNAMRVVEIVNIALRVSVVSLLINVSINYLLISGNLGMPELGARGAAIGTLTARIVEFFIVGGYVLRDKKLGLRLKDVKMAVLKSPLFSDFLAVLGPVVGAGLLWGVANAAQTIILGHMNDSAIAAQSISNTVFLLLKVTSVGAASAAAVIIGKTVGEGDFDKVKAYTRTLQMLFLGIGLILAVIMLLIRVPLLHIYGAKILPETKALANAYMLIQAAVLFTMSYQMPVNAGIIRGGGDVRFIMYLDIIAVVVFVPLSAMAGLVWRWDPIPVILCMNADQFLKCIPACIRVNSYRWIKVLTKE